MPTRLKKNDNVMIVTGDNKGQSGKIIKIFSKTDRALVEAKNLVKRHTKPNRKNQQGGIIEKEASIHMSNLMLVCPKTGKATRIGMQILDTGKRVRISKKSKELIRLNSDVKKLPRMREKYQKEVIPALKQKCGCANIMQVPHIEKIVLNMGVGRAVQDSKLIDEAVACLRDITGQKPVITRAKKAISNFKLREGVAIGCKVTLRGNKMYEFF